MAGEKLELGIERCIPNKRFVFTDAFTVGW